MRQQGRHHTESGAEALDTKIAMIERDEEKTIPTVSVDYAFMDGPDPPITVRNIRYRCMNVIIFGASQGNGSPHGPRCSAGVIVQAGSPELLKVTTNKPFKS